MQKRAVLIAVASLVFAVSGLSHGASHVITVQDNVQFTPNVLNINQGDAVTWSHVGNTFSHTTTNGTGALDPNAGLLWDAPLTPGTSFTYQFNDAGTFDFFCRPHEGVGMTGQIIVAHSVPSSDIWGKGGLVLLLALAGIIVLGRKRLGIIHS
jgi:plastocyanin